MGCDQSLAGNPVPKNSNQNYVGNPGSQAQAPNQIPNQRSPYQVPHQMQNNPYPNQHPNMHQQMNSQQNPTQTQLNQNIPRPNPSVQQKGKLKPGVQMGFDEWPKNFIN